MLEFEKKVLLTQAEYESLMNLSSSNTACFVQTNYYYDSDGFDMNRQGITCRIREKGGKWTATIKKHEYCEGGGNLEQSAEVSSMWDDSFFSSLNVIFQGKLTTKRTILYGGNGLEVVLDANTYLDTQDYELEIEYSSANANHAEFVLRLLEELLQAQMEYDNNMNFSMRTRFAQSKSQRFFERKKLQNKKRGYKNGM